MGRVVWIVVLLMSLACIAEGVRFFHRGRQHGGNLQLWTKSQLPKELLPEEQWFTQQLDHFDPTNQRTWKQVGFFKRWYFKDGNF